MVIIVFPEVRRLLFSGERFISQCNIEISNATDRECAPRKRFENITGNDAVLGYNASFTRDLGSGYNRCDINRKIITASTGVSKLPSNMKWSITDRYTQHMLRHSIKKKVECLLSQHSFFCLLAGKIMECVHLLASQAGIPNYTVSNR